MATAKVGDRVLAIMGSNDDGSVSVFGEGVYEGHFPIDAETCGMIADIAREDGLALENPRIRLDSGETVWGCECWWGPVERAKQRLAGHTVVIVSITAERHRLKGTKR